MVGFPFLKTLGIVFGSAQSLPSFFAKLNASANFVRFVRTGERSTRDTDAVFLGELSDRAMRSQAENAQPGASPTLLGRIQVEEVVSSSFLVRAEFKKPNPFSIRETSSPVEELCPVNFFLRPH